MNNTIGYGCWNVVADTLEGENQQQVGFLKNDNCKLGPDYFYSNPITQDELVKLVTKPLIFESKMIS